MDKHARFMNQIPNNILQEVDRHLYDNIALFRPHVFIEGICLNSYDFNIIVPSSSPPDTYINGRLKSFGNNKIIVMNPEDTILCPKVNPTNPYLSLLIKPALVNNIASEMDLRGGIIRFLNLENNFSFELINAIKNFDYETKRSENFLLMLDCLTIQIVTVLLREFKTNIKKYTAFLPDSNTYVDVAIEYMHEFYSSNITLEDICREINISPFHFIRIFKQKTGTSPHKYLLNIRIKRAEELLRLRQYSVTDTAMLCGFINLSHFSNTFKEITGYTPSCYISNFQTRRF